MTPTSFLHFLISSLRAEHLGRIRFGDPGRDGSEGRMRVGQHVQRCTGDAQSGGTVSWESPRGGTRRTQHRESEEAVDHTIKNEG